MWITFAFGSALFAGVTAVLAKIGIKNTDFTVATAIRTIAFSYFVLKEKLTKKSLFGLVMMTAGTLLLIK